MQFYLALPQNETPAAGTYYAELSPFLELTASRKIFSRLQNCVLRLERFPSVQEILEETDSRIIRTLYQEFEFVKCAARPAILAIRTNLELGITDTGMFMMPDSVRYGRNAFKVIHSWAVTISPFFYVPARILVTFRGTCYRIAFGVSLSLEDVSTSVVKMDLPQDWIDPLEEPLRQLNPFEYDDTLSLDGIDYELTTVSSTSKGALRFGNPFTSPFIAIEKAFFNVAEMIVNEKGQSAEKDYLAQWRKYLAEPKRT